MFYKLIFVVLAQCHYSTVSVDLSFKLTRTVRLKCGPQRLSAGWTSMSRLDCAVVSRERFGNTCKCFMYNRITHLCTPCTGISAYSSPTSDEEGDLFFSDTCESYPDFRWYSVSLIPRVYAAYIQQFLHYTDAASVCECLDSNMFSPKTWQKYNLFLNITDLRYFDWVGLDDITTEGKFVWADDGTEIDATLKLFIFLNGQPDNGQGSNEDCVYKLANGYGEPGKLIDINCDNLALFVCEKQLC